MMLAKEQLLKNLAKGSKAFSFIRCIFIELVGLIIPVNFAFSIPSDKPAYFNRCFNIVDGPGSSGRG